MSAALPATQCGMHSHIAIAGLLALLSTTAGAQVLRCTDAAGNVSYTDQRCPPGARQSGQVQVPDAPPPSSAAPRAYAPPPSQVMAPVPASTPAAPSVSDQRASERAEAQQREIDRLREIERLRREAEYAQDAAGYPYPYPGGYPPPVVQQDMRPQLRNCDAGGCNDTQGNTYNRSTGKLDRYQSLDGRNCRPVGTTVVCR